jgi:hypothetical protein
MSPLPTTEWDSSARASEYFSSSEGNRIGSD